MHIHQNYYNESSGILYIEFSTKEDSDKFYRVLELTYEDVQYYSPDIITKEDLVDVDEFFTSSLIEEYLKDNDLPQELIL